MQRRQLKALLAPGSDRRQVSPHEVSVGDHPQVVVLYVVQEKLGDFLRMYGETADEVRMVFSLPPGFVQCQITSAIPPQHPPLTRILPPPADEEDAVRGSSGAS